MRKARISCSLPEDLAERLDRQVKRTGVARQVLIESAVRSMVSEFEQLGDQDADARAWAALAASELAAPRPRK